MQLELGLSTTSSTTEDAARSNERPVRGGFREGAGRKKSKLRRDPLHRTRPEFSRHHPQHIVLRTTAKVGRLRRGPIYRSMRKVLARTLGLLGFRVVHLSIQHNHLHFIVEAGGKDALRNGMQGLAISAAKAINRACKRKGKVFEYRYHATSIRSPRQARNALAYVLNNWRRHNEDERARAARFAAIDPYSTARSFKGWKEGSAAKMPTGFATFAPMEVTEPKTWLLRVGWERVGSISAFVTPGAIG